jgi:hypothetical protein
LRPGEYFAEDEDGAYLPLKNPNPTIQILVAMPGIKK